MKLDKSGVESYLKDTQPYVYVDEADVEPGVSAKGSRLYRPEEWFFTCHFPGNPLVPGVFLLESLMQTAALCAYTMEGTDFVYAQHLTDVTFRRAVRPGDLLEIEVKVDSIKRGIIYAHGEGYVPTEGERELACKAKFEMVIPGLLKKLAPRPMGVSK